jgi:hypothetical protein
MFDLNLLTMGYTANLKWVCDQRPALARSNRFHWTIVGEWTCTFSPYLPLLLPLLLLFPLLLPLPLHLIFLDLRLLAREQY